MQIYVYRSTFSLQALALTLLTHVLLVTVAGM